jgi:hypothetical protein
MEPKIQRTPVGSRSGLSDTPRRPSESENAKWLALHSSKRRSVRQAQNYRSPERHLAHLFLDGSADHSQMISETKSWIRKTTREILRKGALISEAMSCSHFTCLPALR